MQDNTKDKAAAIPAAGNVGIGQAAGKVSPIVNKSVSGAAWKRIGKLERVGGGVRIQVTLYQEDRVFYLLPADVTRITRDRLTGDVCTVDETPGAVVSTNIGKAFRSRTGRALMIRVPWYSGDLVISWAALQKVMDGTQQAAPVSVVETPAPARECQQNATAALSHGPQGCF